jgi:post-segregation antitoxin (ccd killing protein)
MRSGADDVAAADDSKDRADVADEEVTVQPRPLLQRVESPRGRPSRRGGVHHALPATRHRRPGSVHSRPRTVVICEILSQPDILEKSPTHCPILSATVSYRLWSSYGPPLGVDTAQKLSRLLAMTTSTPINQPRRRVKPARDCGRSVPPSRRVVMRWTGTPSRRIVRRMPRVQVYLPDDLHDQLKQRNLPASELLQVALRAELERQDALAETEQYLDELVAEVGEPSQRQQTTANAIARRVRDRSLDRVG